MLIFRLCVSHKAKRCRRSVMNYLSDHLCFSCAAVCAVSGDLLCECMAKEVRTKAAAAARRVKRMKTEALLSRHFPRECSLICRILLRFLATSARKEFNLVSRVRDALWGITHFRLYCYCSCFYFNWKNNWRKTVTENLECFAFGVLTTGYSRFLCGLYVTPF
jgi:hypothetical protein